MYVVKAGRDFELVATNPMHEVCTATPAPAGDLLIVRTRAQVVAVGRHGTGFDRSRPAA